MSGNGFVERSCSTLLITSGVIWFLIEVLDVPARVGFYQMGVTPAGFRVAIAILVAVTVTASVASGTVPVSRPVALLLIVTVILRAGARSLFLIPTPRDLDTSAPVAVLNTAIVGSGLVALTAAVVIALLNRPGQVRAAWMVVLALVMAAGSGLGLPPVFVASADLLVSISFVLAGIAVFGKRCWSR